MKIRLVKDIERKTSIPKSVIIRAVEKAYGVKLDAPQKNQEELLKRPPDEFIWSLRPLQTLFL